MTKQFTSVHCRFWKICRCFFHWDSPQSVSKHWITHFIFCYSKVNGSLSLLSCPCFFLPDKVALLYSQSCCRVCCVLSIWLTAKPARISARGSYIRGLLLFLPSQVGVKLITQHHPDAPDNLWWLYTPAVTFSLPLLLFWSEISLSMTSASTLVLHPLTEGGVTGGLWEAAVFGKGGVGRQGEVAFNSRCWTSNSL